MTPEGSGSEPPIERIELHKLHAALGVMTVASRRGQPLVFPPQSRLVMWGIVDFGCLGTWPHVEPLALWIRALGLVWGCGESEAFARFDQTLDWVLDQPVPPPRWGT